MRWLTAGVVLPLLLLLPLRPRLLLAQTQSAAPGILGYAGYATYYGIEDGVVAGDVMYDGTPYDPADPTIAAASFLFPLHTWLRVCQPARCIIVQVRDRGLLDQNGVLIDLSRAAYALLFGQLGGKAWVSAYFSDPYTLGVDTAPVITDPLPGPFVTAPSPPAQPAVSAAATVSLAAAATPPAFSLPSAPPAPTPPTATPTPPPPNTITVPVR